jgi:AraC family transcriptional regulator of adaptative response / DNA-3-methyladenine glycosylase II
LLAFLGPRALPGVEEVSGGTWRRGAVEARLDGDAVIVRGASDDEAERVRRIFGLDVDPAAPARVLARDPLLGPLVRARPGLRVPGAWDPFELAVRAVLGQQVTVAGATTLSGRLLEACGGAIEPEAVAAADLSAVGLPRARAATLHGLAEAAANGGLDWSRMQDLPGIGPWTAAYVAMRALGDPDAFPAADLGVRRGLGGLGATAATKRAEAWRPWRSYAVMHLWLGG